MFITGYKQSIYVVNTTTKNMTLKQNLTVTKDDYKIFM